MKYIIILGDGMADRPISTLSGKTPLEVADTPALDFIAKNGKTGLVQTIPSGFPPGSEVGNLSVLGYDVRDCFEGRGTLEAASLGYEVQQDELVLRCNIISTDQEGTILNHHGGHLSSEEGKYLIETLNSHLGNEKVKFIAGLNYKHLLVIKNGNKHINCLPPHDNIGLSTKGNNIAVCQDSSEPGRMTSEETARLLNSLIQSSRNILENHEINIKRRQNNLPQANLIWPWSPGYKPEMKKLSFLYPCLQKGLMITAVDLLKGIAVYTGMEIAQVQGATGYWDTNYEGKLKALVDALPFNDIIFLHVEATDEASHDRDVNLKLKTIEFLDKRIVKPLLRIIEHSDYKVRVAVLADHYTSVVTGEHLSDPVPFAIYETGMKPDAVQKYSEAECKEGIYGKLMPTEFFNLFITEGNESLQYKR